MPRWAHDKQTNYLLPEYCVNQVNVHAFNASRSPDMPKLCGIDWDHGDDITKVPKVWQSLLHTCSCSGKFHFFCYVINVPATEVKTNQKLFKPDCWGNGVVDEKAADLFIHQKMTLYEIEGNEFFNYTGTLPTVDFSVLLEPFLIMEKWSKPARVSLPKTPSQDPNDKSFMTSNIGDPP